MANSKTKKKVKPSQSVKPNPFNAVEGFDWERDYADAFDHETGHYTRSLSSVTFTYGEGTQESFVVLDITDKQADFMRDALNKNLGLTGVK
jgi:hypothetical protein